MLVRIERLADRHQRGGFDCGEPVFNEFLQRRAGQLNRKGFGKTYVALAEDDLKVAGFVTVSAGQVKTQQLASNLKLPRYPAPVLRVGRLAVATIEQGRGIGQKLMAFALQLAFDMAQQVGLYAVIVDAKSDQARVFHESLSFTPTLDDPCFCRFLTCKKCAALPISYPKTTAMNLADLLNFSACKRSPLMLSSPAPQAPKPVLPPKGQGAPH